MFQKDDWISLINILLKLAITNGERGDFVYALFPWHIRDEYVFARLWWKLSTKKDNPDWNYELDYHTIQASRQQRLDQLSQQSFVVYARLHSFLSFATLIVSTSPSEEEIWQPWTLKI